MPAELSDECKRCLQHERVERDLHLGAQLDAICGLGVDDSGRELMRWWACQPMAIPAARHEQQVVKVVDEMLERYFAALRVVADAPARQEDAVALIQQLEKWHGDVRGLESLLPPVPTLAGAADDIITRILRARVAFTFGNVAAMWRDALVALSLASTAPKDSWVSAVDVAYGKAMASFQVPWSARLLRGFCDGVFEGTPDG